VVRGNIEISATLAAMAVGAVVVPPKTAGRHVSAAAPTTETAAFSRLSSIPSHNGVYRASLIPSPSEIDGSDQSLWTVEVRTAQGTPVDRARLAIESWMPDHERLGATAARVTAYLGDGRYRVEGLRLDRRGWWNVRLTVAAPSATDSLAFNVVR
jgi:hypothetical protein